MPTTFSKCLLYTLSAHITVEYRFSYISLWLFPLVLSCLTRDGSVVIDHSNKPPLSLRSCINRRKCRNGAHLYNHLCIVNKTVHRFSFHIITLML